MRSFCLWVIISLILIACPMAWGTSVAIGDVFLQQDDNLGTVTVVLQNNTGLSESFPDFPVTDSLDFSNLSVTLDCFNASCQSDLGGASETFNLGTLASGNSDTSLSFNSNDQFADATITATMSLVNLNLDNGDGTTSPFSGSAIITYSFLPVVNGQYLVALDLSNPSNSIDTGVLADAGTVGTSPVPESGAWTFILLGMGAFVVANRRQMKTLLFAATK